MPGSAQPLGTWPHHIDFHDHMTTSTLVLPVAAPRGSSIAGKAYWGMLGRIALTAATIDGAYIVLFLLLDSVVLAAVNVISIAMYLGAYALIRRRHNMLGVVLIWLEVTAHSALGSLLIGWESGFHYYLLLFIPAIVVANTKGYAMPMVLGLLVYYLGLKTLCEYLGPLAPLPPHRVDIVNAIHVCLIFGMFAALAGFYRRTILAAEVRLLKQATLDPLTGLSNRGHFETLAANELARCQRSGAPVAMMLCDVDHFKQVNDRYGHAAGDQALVHVAQVLRANLRECDVLARWGGEEFLALMPDSSLQAAHAAAERIRTAIEAHPLTIDGTPISITLSFGVAQLHGSHDLDDATARADKALYESKGAGRNRVSTG